jgi:hypothetical protein
MATYQDELLETVTCKCYKFLFEALWARVTHGSTPLEPGKACAESQQMLQHVLIASNPTCVLITSCRTGRSCDLVWNSGGIISIHYDLVAWITCEVCSIIKAVYIVNIKLQVITTLNAAHLSVSLNYHYFPTQGPSTFVPSWHEFKNSVALETGPWIRYCSRITVSTSSLLCNRRPPKRWFSGPNNRVDVLEVPSDTVWGCIIILNYHASRMIIPAAEIAHGRSRIPQL